MGNNDPKDKGPFGSDSGFGNPWGDDPWPSESRPAGGEGVGRSIRDLVGTFENAVQTVASSGAILPEAEYGFVVENVALGEVHVRSVRIREAISELYEGSVEIVSRDPIFPGLLLGQNCRLRIAREGHERYLLGVIRRVEDLGSTANRSVVRVTVVPQLWRLTQRINCRVCQNLSSLDIVKLLLREAKIYQEPGMYTEKLVERYDAWEYSVQYREDEFSYLLRLLAEDGILFFFQHDPDFSTEQLVLVDAVTSMPRMQTMDGVPLMVRGPESSTASVESIRLMNWTEQLIHTAVEINDYDFTRPSMDLRGRSAIPVGSNDPSRRVYDWPGWVNLGPYSHETLSHGVPDVQKETRLRVEEIVQDERVGTGYGNAIGMTPGYVFQLLGHDRGTLADRNFVLLAVEHRGDMPEQTEHDTTDSDAIQGISRGKDRYFSKFTAVLDRVKVRPKRVAPRPKIGLQTATVVGPVDDDIYTDGHGRIKVLFRWDQTSAREDTSCWIRVVQPWAGADWGTLFIPRVGMEVVVDFLEGSPDRPVVLGSVYNGVQRPIVNLPEQKSISGIRTRSTPPALAMGRFNELHFNDAAMAERIYLRAQRNFDEEVLNDHTTRVDHDQSNTVGHDQTETVHNDQTQTIHGNRRNTVHGDRHNHTVGSHHVQIDTDRTTRIERNEDYTVQGDTRVLHKGELQRQVDGREIVNLASTNQSVVGEQLVKIGGHYTLVVGSHDAPKSFTAHVEGRGSISTTKPLHLSSDKEILLSVGDSHIRMSSNRIELSSPTIVLAASDASLKLDDGNAKLISDTLALVKSATTVLQSTDGGVVRLTSNASINGSAVKLKDGSGEDDSSSGSSELTQIELKDQDGNPIPNQRFIIHLSDGTEMGGVLDADGKASVELEEDATIEFPELGNVESQ